MRMPWRCALPSVWSFAGLPQTKAGALELGDAVPGRVGGGAPPAGASRTRPSSEHHDLDHLGSVWSDSRLGFSCLMRHRLHPRSPLTATWTSGEDQPLSTLGSPSAELFICEQRREQLRVDLGWDFLAVERRNEGSEGR